MMMMTMTMIFITKCNQDYCRSLKILLAPPLPPSPPKHNTLDFGIDNKHWAPSQQSIFKMNEVKKVPVFL